MTDSVNTRKGISCLIAFLCFAAAVAVDQITKYLAVIHLKNKTPFIIVDGVFQLRYLENRGAAFGLMENRQILFIAGACLVVAVFIFLFLKVPFSRRFLPLRICAVLLCAGAVGNLIDRIRLNYVVDFFYFNLIDFPIFNVADCYVVISCIFFVILILFYYKDDDFNFLKFRKK